MTIRRSNAAKCGSHKTGFTGSTLIDSRNTCDKGLGPLWNLKIIERKSCEIYISFVRLYPSTAFTKRIIKNKKNRNNNEALVANDSNQIFNNKFNEKLSARCRSYIKQ